ncbi:hypothetical protein, partial [Treponema saccharophilum]|uniref:hypothetical protein n=1 Tax=Treponema saccharophilum TaxID=165 RepID=UPI00131F04E9
LQNIHNQKHTAKIHHGFIAQARDKNKAPPIRRKTSRSHIGAFFPQKNNKAPRKTPTTTKNTPPKSTTVLSRKSAIKTKPLQHAEKQVALTLGLSFPKILIRVLFTLPGYPENGEIHENRITLRRKIRRA